MKEIKICDNTFWALINLLWVTMLFVTAIVLILCHHRDNITAMGAGYEKIMLPGSTSSHWQKTDDDQ